MGDLAMVALIGGGFSIVVALINKLVKENRGDHAFVSTSLGRIEQKIDGHVEGHNE